MTSRAPRLIAVIVASLLLAGCAAPHVPAVMDAQRPTATTPGDAMFYDPANPPAPESTISPGTDVWSDFHPPAGYSVILLTYAGDAEHTKTLVDAVDSWARSEDVTVTPVVVKSHDKLVEATLDAIDREPDLIITVGNILVDPLAAVSAGYLAQQFLVIGAEIAEPTSNVTAVDWSGAGYRGEGLGTPTTYDPKTFTKERASRAIQAGVAAVLNRANGFVIWLD